MNTHTDKIYAPVLIPTLCRAKHFIRCVESLKKNLWAKYTEVYIALDYPENESHWEGYLEICRYLEGDFSVFPGFYVIKRKSNYGVFKNMIELQKMVLEKYDRYIRTDDDAEFSPNFIEYMDKTLCYYENDPEVIGVTGYSYPVHWHISEGKNVFKNNAIFPMWGTGFWKDKYLNVQEKIVNDRYLRRIYDSVVNNGKINLLTDARYVEYIGSCVSSNDGKLIDCVSDVALGIYMMLEGKYVATPITNKVRNWGFDGTGVYCQNIAKCEGTKITARNYLYSNQDIDSENYFNINPDTIVDDAVNKEILNRFDSRSDREMMRAKVKLLLYCMLGKEKFLKLRKMLRGGVIHEYRIGKLAFYNTKQYYQLLGGCIV